MSNFEEIDTAAAIPFRGRLPDGYDGNHPRWKEAERPWYEEVRNQMEARGTRFEPNPTIISDGSDPGGEYLDDSAYVFHHSEHDPHGTTGFIAIPAHPFDNGGPAKDPLYASNGFKEIPQHEPGAKLDADKPDMSLLLDFAEALEEVALVGTYGMVKYSRGGWRKVPNGIVRYTAALLRHLFKREKYDTDPWYDTYLGLPFKGRVRHDAQVAWNALARLQRRLNEEQGRG